MVEVLETKKNNHSHTGPIALFLLSVFILACTLGEGLGGSWGSNEACNKYLGCTSGFFGYDAVEHFIFGVAVVWIIVWLFQRFPQFSLLHNKRWKNILIIIALVVFVGVIWEFLECAHDYFRLSILHQALLNWKLHINSLDQPTNLDTMGDMFFGLLGSTLSLFFVGL